MWLSRSGRIDNCFGSVGWPTPPARLLWSAFAAPLPADAAALAARARSAASASTALRTADFALPARVSCWERCCELVADLNRKGAGVVTRLLAQLKRLVALHLSVQKPADNTGRFLLRSARCEPRCGRVAARSWLAAAEALAAAANATTSCCQPAAASAHSAASVSEAARSAAGSTRGCRSQHAAAGSALRGGAVSAGGHVPRSAAGSATARWQRRCERAPKQPSGACATPRRGGNTSGCLARPKRPPRARM